MEGCGVRDIPSHAPVHPAEYEAAFILYCGDGLMLPLIAVEPTWGMAV